MEFKVVNVDFGSTVITVEHPLLKEKAAFSTGESDPNSVAEIVGACLVDKVGSTDEMLDKISETKGGEVQVFIPSIGSMKSFVAELFETFQDGNMSHIKDYEEGCVKLPQELKDFIYNLVSK